jgi:hypothetical protein
MCFRMIKKYLRLLCKGVFKVAIGLSAILMVAFLSLEYFWNIRPFMGSDFDRKIWFSALDCSGLNHVQCAYKMEDCSRASMYRDLEKNYLKIGFLKKDVIAILGEGKEYPGGTSCFDYPLGFCSAMGIDLDFLSVCYDENSTIKRVYHYQS